MIFKSRSIRWTKLRLFFSTNGWKRAAYLKKKKCLCRWEMGATIIQEIYRQNHI